MKLADSLNPATQAENIKKLNAGLEAVDAKTLPGTSTATTGQILKLTGENKTPSWADEYSYTPPAYSETEVNTGQKWIDGKDVYCQVLSGDFGEITATVSPIIGNIEGINFLYSVFNCIRSNGIVYSPNNNVIYSPSTGNFTINGVSTTFSEGSYNVILYYTKHDPAPETRDDDTPEEVKETKTRKKTTK